MEAEVVTYVYHTTCVDLESLGGPEPSQQRSPAALPGAFFQHVLNRCPHYLLNNSSEKISFGCAAKNKHFSESPSKYLDLLFLMLGTSSTNILPNGVFCRVKYHHKRLL